MPARGVVLHRCDSRDWAGSIRRARISCLPRVRNFSLRPLFRSYRGGEFLFRRGDIAGTFGKRASGSGHYNATVSSLRPMLRAKASSPSGYPR